MQASDHAPTILVNGEAASVISVRDRGLQYGHGLFETIAVKQGQIEYWEQHLSRLMDGCERLMIKKPDPSVLLYEAKKLITSSAAESGVLKLIYSCGSGGRGYKTPEPSSPSRIFSLTEYPRYPSDYYDSGITIRLCMTRLAINPALAGMKHLNRLEQVLARNEWSDPEIAEGLMLDTQGFLREGTMSNVFFVKDGTLCTPEVKNCGVEGVMRNVVLQLAESLAIKIYIDDFTPADIVQAEELFLTNSLIGIWPVKEAILDEQTITFSRSNLITKKLINNKK